MIIFAKIVSEKWNISPSLAANICSRFEQGDLPYVLCDYVPVIAAEIDINQLWEIYDFLSEAAALDPKRKRVLNALERAGKLTDEAKMRIELTMSGEELDDMVIPYRPNPRSKAQLALKKGLGELADAIEKQDNTTTPVEELAQRYLGKDESLKTVDDVISGVKDILAERIAYDETIRAMVREFCYEDGFFEIIAKNRKDPRFAQYRDKLIPLHELSKEELLSLMTAEDAKEIRAKISVQLFRITEVLRHHFITNPDSAGFDLICQTIDDAWQRLLLPIVERDVKFRLRRDAESWALNIIAQEFDKQRGQKQVDGILFAVSVSENDTLGCVALNPDGRLVGATSEKQPLDQTAVLAERFTKFAARYKPSLIVIRDSVKKDEVKKVIDAAFSGAPNPVETAFFTVSARGEGLVGSSWITNNFADLDDSMKAALATGLLYRVPISLVAEIGAQYFDMHPFQKYVPQQRLAGMVNRKVAETALHEGIPVRDAPDSILKQIPLFPPELLAEMRGEDIRQPFQTKQDLLRVKGMTEVLFRNLAGYVILPGAVNALDRTIVHPDFYPDLEEVGRQLNVGFDSIVANPSMILSVPIDDFEKKLHFQKRVVEQLKVGQKYAGSASMQPKRKLRLTELQEDMVISGRVTNITPFGVFVNINAVCDGLIHISQLADSYVESPEQVVSLGDRVTVRIVKIDVKKRRVSLSMKNLGINAPKVKPTKGQIDTLIDHFSNR